MKVVIKTFYCLFLVAVIASCASGNVVVADAPPLPDTPQVSAPPTPVPPKEEKMETRSTGTPVFNLGTTTQRTPSSAKSEVIKSTTN